MSISSSVEGVDDHDGAKDLFLVCGRGYGDVDENGWLDECTLERKMVSCARSFVFSVMVRYCFVMAAATVDELTVFGANIDEGLNSCLGFEVKLWSLWQLSVA